MKKATLCMMFLFMLISAGAETKSWDFTVLSSADEALMTADATNWKYDSGNKRYAHITALTAAPALAGTDTVSCVKGLLFTVTASSSGNLRLGYKSGNCMWVADGSVITVPDRKAGEYVKIVYTTSKKGASRTVTAGNVTGTMPSASDKSTQYTGSGTVTADGDVTFTASGALYIYSIAVGEEEEISSGGGSETGSDYDNPTDSERGLTYTDASVINTPAPGTAKALWCSPDGDDTTADGTEEKPFFDLQNAINIAEAGTTIYMKAGTYVYSKRININDRNGTHDAYITVMCPDGRAVLDFSGMPYHAHSDNPYQGIRLTSSYWHFYKIDICNASDNGMLIERNKPTGGSATDVVNRTQDAHDNIIEFCHFYKNGDTGLQMKNLASFNYVLNCDAYQNKDESDGDADGFAPKISVGDGNYFYGCRAYNNSDDGYDVFFKSGSGFEDNKTIVFENCLAYENGWIDGVQTSGNMNGFKLGSDQGRMNVVLNRCLAVNNGSKGFDQNHNSGDIILNNCTGYALLKYGTNGKNYTYRIYESLASGSICEISNCVNIADYSVTTDNGKGEYGSKEWKNKGEAGNGRCDVSTASLVQTSNWLCNASNFQSIGDVETLVGARLEDGSLPWDNITWGHPMTDNTSLVDAGTVIEENTRYASTGVAVPAVKYAGAAPDLGAFEVNMESKQVVFGAAETDGIGRVVSAESDGRRVRLVQAFSGLVVLSVEGAKAAETYTVTAYDASGARLGRQRFNGTGTSFCLPRLSGIVLLQVSGPGLKETLKTVIE